MTAARFSAPKLMALGSGKGGTGKTFVTLALAQALADRGERVLVCDADLGLSNTSVQLGLSEGGDLPGVLSGSVALVHAVVRVKIPEHAPFDLLSAPPGTGALADSDGAAARYLIDILRRATQYERVLIDLGAGISDAVLTLAALADETIVVMTPDPSSLTDAYAFVKLMMRRSGGRLPSVLVNLATGVGEAKRSASALIHAAHTFLDADLASIGHVPHDHRVGESIRRQSALLALYPRCPAGEAITALAEFLGKPVLKIASSLR